MNTQCRAGKIARLPSAVREELNRRMVDREAGVRRVGWWGGLEAAAGGAWRGAMEAGAAGGGGCGSDAARGAEWSATGVAAEAVGSGAGEPGVSAGGSRKDAKGDRSRHEAEEEARLREEL